MQFFVVQLPWRTAKCSEIQTNKSSVINNYYSLQFAIIDIGLGLSWLVTQICRFVSCSQ